MRDDFFFEREKEGNERRRMEGGGGIGRGGNKGIRAKREERRGEGGGLEAMMMIDRHMPTRIYSSDNLRVST